MSTSDKICNVGAVKSISNDDVCELAGKLEKIKTANDNEGDNDKTVCANCGKEGTVTDMNTCNKCKVTTYCNAVCKKVHKKKHKKECEEHQRLATEKHNEELRIAAELHDIELFKQPPPLDDCPICFIRLPTLKEGYRYKACCGKMICSGCIHAPVYDDQGNIVDNKKCPFCRVPTPFGKKEMIEREKERVELEDPIAMYNQGSYYRYGRLGYPQDYTKALELFHQASKLGFAESYKYIGNAYHFGQGVEADKNKATYYWELGAMGGDVDSRYNLGIGDEDNAGNYDRALKHHMIAVRGGHAKSLEAIKELFTEGHASKDDYMKALQLYQTYLGEIKSPQRDKAAAYDYEEYRYY